MKTTEFNPLVKETLNDCQSTLIRKAREYATDERLHNFKEAAKINDTTPALALWGMMTKHFVSIKDIVFSNKIVTNLMLDEKINDMINYLILLKAVLREKNNKDAVTN